MAQNLLLLTSQVNLLTQQANLDPRSQLVTHFHCEAVMSSHPDIGKHLIISKLHEAQDLDGTQRATEERTKLGHLRGGAAGHWSGKAWHGACGRLAALRSLGLEPPLDSPLNTREGFAAGYANEAIVLDQLRKTWPGGVLGEDEGGLKGEIGGRVLSIRPDITLTDKAGNLERIVECKQIMSLWTAVDVHYKLVPKVAHLIQAAAQSSLAGRVPVTLLYSNRAQFHVSTAPGWLRDRFNKVDGKGALDVQYREDGVPMKILPFHRPYDLEWAGDFLTYWTPGMDAPKVTQLTESGVLAAYAEVASLVDLLEAPGEGDGTGAPSRPVPIPRPSASDLGVGKNYSACQYCDVREVCDDFENNLSAWFDHMRSLLGGAQ